MEKKNNLLVISLLCSLVLIAVPPVHCRNRANNGPNELKRWYKNFPRKEEIQSQLFFYQHVIVSGPNPTNVPIAQSNFTSRSPTKFGLISAIDDLLTTDASPNSTMSGRAQGLVASTSLTEIGYHMSINLVFTDGSSLTVVGHNKYLNDSREVPIVGGSGRYRLARGTALLNTLFNKTSGDALIEWNVLVRHVI